MNKIKIAFIDTAGLVYNGNTLTYRGLGGSESAVIYISRELVKLNCEVRVFNHCEAEGFFDGVQYSDLSKAQDIKESYDIVICSRSCIPYAPLSMKDEILNKYHYDITLTHNLIFNAKKKILWLHDTFLHGDEYLENFANNNYFDEIFTLSDWHSNYIMNGHEWRGRYFEVLKRKIWQTRNGIHSYIDEVDIRSKDKDQFCYTSAVSKGLFPLLEVCWKKIRERIPTAKIKIVGGYYEGAGPGRTPDEQELQWRDLKNRYDGKEGIEFTGVLTQAQVAEVVAQSSLMIYPPAFPETFGMCILEAINYNTPVVGSRFGAMEQIATEQTCYLTNYEAYKKGTPNPRFNFDEFADLVARAHNDDYLRQQKVYACNEYKPYIGWDSVALQWKQHFSDALKLFLSIDELSKVRDINYNVRRLFNVRFINEEDVFDRLEEDCCERHIDIITPVYNSEEYITNCIQSVASQLYSNYHMYIIDDMSTDGTASKVEEYISQLPESVKDKFTLIKNKIKLNALGNQIETIIKYAKADDIIVLLDGDDWLVNNPDIFSLLNREYAAGAEFTYGSCHSIIDNINLIAQPYPEEVILNKGFRNYLFPWNMPYTHLRTFSKKLFDKVDPALFKNENGEYFGAGGDTAIFYNLIEECDPAQIKCIQQVLVEYNDTNPLNDYKVNSNEQTKNADFVRKEQKSAPVGSPFRTPITLKNKRILIATPTAKYIESETFTSIYRLIKPENAILDFQFFYGYNIAQVRNLIAYWANKNNFDYIFWVDSDIILPNNSLVELLNMNTDIAAGIYIQRKPETKIPEAYISNGQGGMKNLALEEVQKNQIIEVAGVGFGCVLTTVDCLNKVGYPQFEYYNAIDHRNTISEDVDFAMKANKRGYKIYLNTAIKCEHIGNIKFTI